MKDANQPQAKKRIIKKQQASKAPPQESNTPKAKAMRGDTSPAGVAHDLAQDALDRLTELAKGGDTKALRYFHDIACAVTEWLNTNHIDYAAAVLEWPVLLPQEREARKAVADSATKMRIGSVKAGGEGRPEILEYGSEKGFSISNLRRVNFARAVLRSLCYSPACWDTECQELFASGTGIVEYNDLLLLRIRDLPDYEERTREEWVGAILGVMDLNPELAPKKLAGRAVTIKYAPRPDGSRERVVDERGGVLGKAIRAGLKNVPAIPGGWSG